MNNINSILSQSYIQQKQAYKNTEKTQNSTIQTFSTNLDVKLPDSRFYLPLIAFKGLNSSHVMFGSALTEARKNYTPTLPEVYSNGINSVSVEIGKPTKAVGNAKEIEALFPNTYGQPIVSFKPTLTGENINKKGIDGNIGVILSGGQAPGGHNVVAGIFYGLKEINPESKLIGFFNGPKGIITNKQRDLPQSKIKNLMNTGGFNMIGSGRDKIEKEEHLEKTLENCKKNNIKALVVVGGDDSNTNAAVIAEYFKQKGSDIQVIGVPKTIDGDLKNEMIETSFGFDTATKVYSELIGNLQADKLSSKKYWHFVKLMGRDASHITLECALQSKPNMALISEEIAKEKKSFNDVIEDIGNVVIDNSNKDEDFGVILIPEGLLLFTPETKKLFGNISEILGKIKNDKDKEEMYSTYTTKQKVQYMEEHLTSKNGNLYKSLPDAIKPQLLKLDSHGNVEVSGIDTERLLMDKVSEYIDKKNEFNKNNPEWKKVKFSPKSHFFGYEGRCAAPSNFDANYCYALGYNAVALINNGLTGYMSTIKNLDKPAEKWNVGGMPLTGMMNVERRNGADKPVIKKALVDLEGAPFKKFKAERDDWKDGTDFETPGPIQYWGPDEVCNAKTKTLEYESAVRAAK
ncbi:MAG: diphosphate--fructose-6-phosphate 1-phosphotransferase [Candidatus Gastranaerophilales bacterium]|nr:diphosphate--fructose-6-phosphate 1-phosphotransferase [Candidatus Gastranaerophilales bacterium]